MDREWRCGNVEKNAANEDVAEECLCCSPYPSTRLDSVRFEGCVWLAGMKAWMTRYQDRGIIVVSDSRVQFRGCHAIAVMLSQLPWLSLLAQRSMNRIFFVEDIHNIKSQLDFKMRYEKKQKLKHHSQ